MAAQHIRLDVQLLNPDMAHTRLRTRLGNGELLWIVPLNPRAATGQGL